MFLKYRPARLSDLPDCVHCLRDRSAYTEQALRELVWLWREMLVAGDCTADVIEAADCSVNNGILFFTLLVFLKDDFVEQLKSGLQPYVGLQVLNSRNAGERPYMSLREIQSANATSGVNILVLNSGSPEWVMMNEAGREVRDRVIDFTYYILSGYRSKAVFIDAYNRWQRDWGVSAGFRVQNEYEHYYTHIVPTPEEERVTLLGINEIEGRASEGSVIAPVFNYRQPRFFLRPAEQELLRNALNGDTDKELAEQLSLAPVTVKKRWKSIYDRVEAVSPEVLSLKDGQELDDRNALKKKRHLLSYIQHHLEELRPIDPRITKPQ